MIDANALLSEKYIFLKCPDSIACVGWMYVQYIEVGYCLVLEVWRHVI